jgi:hypothetical protein
MSANLVKVTNPAGAPQLSSFIESERLRGKCSQREIDRVAFRGQPVPAHYGCASFVVNIYVCACHTHTIHQRVLELQADVHRLEAPVEPTQLPIQTQTRFPHP